MMREYGSDFQYFEPKKEQADNIFDSKDSSLFFSGRAALLNLLSYGIKYYGWKKIGFPQYYCHDVVKFCANLPIEIEYYKFNPFSPKTKNIEWEDEESNVFINVDYFGAWKINTDFLKKSVIIDDVTHNLMSLEKSSADFCFGSLRKQLPLAVGGFCIALKDKVPIPSSVKNDFTKSISIKRLAAMILKAEYLEGKYKKKDTFRDIFIETEKQFGLAETNASMPDLIRNQLSCFDIRKLIQKTWNNVDLARKKIIPQKCQIINSDSGTNMGIIFLFEEEKLKDKAINYLVKHNIYPATLWPSQLIEEDRYFADRMLFLHVDFRYSTSDIDYITFKLNEFFQNA